MTPIQKQRLAFYRFAMSLSCALIVGSLYFSITDTHASRFERVCERGYIGHAYNPSLVKRCTPLWNTWSEQIKLSFHQN